MADINQFTFTGHLASDAAVRNTSTGKQVLTFTVAVNTGFGQYAKTLFIKVQQWGAKSANLVPYLKKGTLIGASGELSTTEWTSQQTGEVHNDLVVTVFSFNLLGGSKRDATPSDERSAGSKDSRDDVQFYENSSEEEELPF